MTLVHLWHTTFSFFFSFLQSISSSVLRMNCQTVLWFPPAASSFSFCRPAVEYRALPEDFKHQLSRRTGGNLTWHDGRGQKTAGGRTVKLLQQPGTEALQVPDTSMTSTCQTTQLVQGLITASGLLYQPSPHMRCDRCVSAWLINSHYFRQREF